MTAQQERDMRPIVGDVVWIWPPKVGDVPAGWTRAAGSPACWQVWTAQSVLPAGAQHIGTSRSALRTGARR